MPDYPICSDCDHIEEYLNSFRDVEDDLFTVELILNSVKIAPKYEDHVKIILNVIRILQKLIKEEPKWNI